MGTMNKLLSLRGSTFALIMLLVAVLITGCANLQEGLRMLEKPSARVTGARLAAFGLRESTLEFDVQISNPYRVSLPLSDVEYNLSSRDDSILGGMARMDGSVPSQGKKTVRIPVRISYRDLLDPAKGIRPGNVIPYRVDLTLLVKTPGDQTIELPMSKEGKLPVPAVPEVQLKSVQWRELGFTKTTGVLNIGVRNPHVFSVNMETMNFSLDLGGRKIFESSVTDSPRFDAEQSRSIQVPVSLSLTQLGSGLLSMFRQNSASYRLHGEITLDTPYGQLTVPYNSTGNTPFRRN